MITLFCLFVASAVASGVLLVLCHFRSQVYPRNRRRQPGDLDFQRWRRHKAGAPTFDIGRQLERTLAPRINGHPKHERNKLP